MKPTSPHERHDTWSAVMSLKAFERVLFAAGCEYIRSESSHHQYRTPSGKRIHVCGQRIGPRTQKAIRRLLDQEREAQSYGTR